MTYIMSRSGIMRHVVITSTNILSKQIEILSHRADVAGILFSCAVLLALIISIAMGCHFIRKNYRKDLMMVVLV